VIALNITPEVGKATVMQHLAVLAAVESRDGDVAEGCKTKAAETARFVWY
jgi:hypothetical protein